MPRLGSVTDDADTRRRRARTRIGLSVLAVVVVAAVAGAVVVAMRMPEASTDLADPPRGALEVSEGVGGRWQVGSFTITIDTALHVSHPDAASAVWETPDAAAFVGAARGAARFTDSTGLLRVHDRLAQTWPEQTLERAELEPGGSLLLAGTLAGEATRQGEPALPWAVRLSEGAPGRLDVSVIVDPPADRLYVTAGLAPGEGVHGFGAQSAAWDLRGRRIALIPREQGIGRGEQPLSFLVDLAAQAAGGQDTTYLVSGMNVTDEARSMAYRGTAISSADLRPDDRMVWEVWADRADFALAAAATPAAAIAVQAEWAGSGAAPPAWTQTGLIAGLQGGTDEVRAKIGVLQDAGVPLAAVWLQDWVGRRTTSFGDRLQWNWSLDTEWYPEWDALVGDLADQGIRVLTYVNPALSADSGAASADRGGRDLHAEAAGLGHLALDEEGNVLETDQHGFTAATVDLSDPAAREWLAQVIADEVAGAGASGWMADFAEGPPPDAQLEGGVGSDWRVRWPLLWQEVNNRALELAGLADDGFVWHRSGGTASAGTADAVWLGDQTQDWSGADGLASAITIAQSLAASGMTQVHGDIGGYTSVALPLFGDVARDDELVVRWAEASLLQPVLRTHEGNRPDAAAQPAENPELAAHLGVLARLWVALGPERARATHGAQHPFLVDPVPELRGAADHELQLGPDLLLAPVLVAGADAVEVVLPPGRWQHSWTGQVHGSDDAVTRVTVAAPLGQPALFAREGSAVAGELDDFVRQEG